VQYLTWKKWTTVIVLVIAAALVFYAAKARTIQAIAATDVQVTPFLLEQRTVSFSKSPEGQMVENRITARRSDGSTAMMGVFPGKPEKPIRRVDWMDGRTGTIVDSIKAKMMGLVSDSALAKRKRTLQSPPEKCTRPGETTVGSATMEGLETWVVQKTSGGDSLSVQSRLTEWRVPRLSCFAVQMQRESNKDGQWKLLTEVRPLFIRIGDPGTALFEVDGAYDEMKPSEFKRNLLSSAGVTEKDCPKCFSAGGDDAADATYQEFQHRRTQ
jgi:hypothetical protein